MTIQIFIMKKAIFITLFILPLSCQSQSKREQKILNKFELTIINRGLDLGDAFVPIIEVPQAYAKHMKDLYISNWSDALLQSGLEVGNYHDETTSKDTENREMVLSKSRVFNGRYIFKVRIGNIKIVDLTDDNKLVASISFKHRTRLNSSVTTAFLRLHIIEQLIKSNK